MQHSIIRGSRSLTLLAAFLLAAAVCAPCTGAEEAPAPPATVAEIVAGLANKLVVTSAYKTQALSIEGTSRILMPTGTVLVHSRSPRAVSITGASRLRAQSAGARGGVQTEGVGKADVAEKLELKEAQDPLAALPWPDISKLQAFQDVAIGEERGGREEVQTLQPGIYDSIKLTGRTKVTLSPGTYVIRNFFDAEGFAEVQGDEVLILNYGKFKVGTLAKITLSAPTEGPYKGICYFQHRANAAPLLFEGTGRNSMDGVVYVPGAPLQLGGVSSFVAPTVVADTVRLTGSNEMKIEVKARTGF